ncbi:MAG TPA: GNAT family N-acetyltransferase [Chitinophagaceae bacterium]|nr:GNAT family N-acetyltransferase [Chitinophagaceae bacterium]
MIKISQATPEEIPVVVDMRILFADELGGKPDPETEARMRLQLETYFSEELNRSYLCYYAEVNGTVASIAGLVIRKQPGSLKNPSGKWGYIMNVFTLPEFRRLGLSAQVMRALMDKAIELGITSFELHATPQGEPTYQKLGFQLYAEPTYRKFIEG